MTLARKMGIILPFRFQYGWLVWQSYSVIHYSNSTLSAALKARLFDNRVSESGVHVSRYMDNEGFYPFRKKNRQRVVQVIHDIGILSIARECHFYNLAFEFFIRGIPTNLSNSWMASKDRSGRTPKFFAELENQKVSQFSASINDWPTDSGYP